MTQVEHTMIKALNTRAEEAEDRAVKAECMCVELATQLAVRALIQQGGVDLGEIQEKDRYMNCPEEKRACESKEIGMETCITCWLAQVMQDVTAKFQNSPNTEQVPVE